MITVLLQQIRDAKPCADGWAKLLDGLGTPPLETQLTIGDVAKINGAEDALWCLRLIEDRRAVVGCIMPAVKRASAHATDKRVHDTIASLDRWLAGDDSVDLEEAAAAAEAAAAVAEAAKAAAWAAAACVATEWDADKWEADKWEVEAEASAAECVGVAALWAAWKMEAERQHQVTDLVQYFGLLATKEKVDENAR